MVSVEAFLAASFWLAMKSLFGLWVFWCVLSVTIESMVRIGARLDSIIDADERRRRGVIDG